MPNESSSIPVNHILAAANDKELKKLLRARLTATRHVDDARQEVADADAAIDAYIAKTYPALSEDTAQQILGALRAPVSDAVRTAGVDA